MPETLRKEEEFMYKYLQTTSKRPAKKKEAEDSDDQFDKAIDNEEDTDPEMEAFA